MRNRKISLTVLFVLLFFSQVSIYSQQSTSESKKRVGVDLGAALSIGLFSESPSGPFEYEEPITVSLASGRFAFDTSVLYKLNDSYSIGAVTGLHIMKSIFQMQEHLYIDIPWRIALKIGSRTTFIEPFLGYFWCVTSYLPSGFEIGSRFSLAGLFIEGSTILGSDRWGHVSLGVTIPDIVRF